DLQLEEKMPASHTPSTIRAFRVFRSLLFILVLSLLGSAASAQTTGNIVGKVSDPSGALVPDVTVKATNQATGFARDTRTNISGEYLLTLLPVGRYTVSAEKQGFEAFKLPDVVVSLNENLRVDVPLVVGKVAESISVVGSGAAEVETRSATLGKVV